MKNKELGDELNKYFASVFTIEDTVKTQKQLEIRKQKCGMNSEKAQ